MLSFTSSDQPRIKSELRDFFLQFSDLENGDWKFPYCLDNIEITSEYWGSRSSIPSTAGIWLAADGFPAQVRHLFLGYSASELLCFCQYYSNWLDTSVVVAFAALGLLPSYQQLNFLYAQFPNAKVHTVFGAGLTGKVMDCKVALWLGKTDASFEIRDELVKINYRGKSFNIAECSFSLNRFEKTTGLRLAIRTHKPKGGFMSYQELFMSAF
ncbi:hypothetical protein [Pedobacter sp. Hv1]|uniref:hypothetical protein n=1 Tax=Pedobacter sp. Hv1 TaxID=1740090 RepID=UPI0006D8B094|nr:hypothetical protein [Pedobacter sp. Hv1]KQB99854.1 hypothetical protein AQF98_15165 [Pedobacter sp. Hv1]